MIIGYTTGVYDMFHYGYLNILKRAKDECDFLIVSVSTDELVKKKKRISRRLYLMRKELQSSLQLSMLIKLYHKLIRISLEHGKNTILKKCL